MRELCLTYSKCSVNSSCHWIVILSLFYWWESYGKEKLKSFFLRWQCCWQHVTLRERSSMHVKNLKIHIAGGHQRAHYHKHIFPRWELSLGSMERSELHGRPGRNLRRWVIRRNLKAGRGTFTLLINSWLELHGMSIKALSRRTKLSRKKEVVSCQTLCSYILWFLQLPSARHYA